MNNNSIHQSLVELEENLKNLESARTQVERVSEKSEQVISALAEVLGQIEALHQEFELEKSGFSAKINESLDGFDQRLVAKSNSITSKVKELNLDFSTAVNDSIKKLYEYQKQVDDERGTYTTSINKNLESFKRSLESKLEALGEKTETANTHFSSSVDNSLVRLKEFQANIDSEKKIYKEGVETSIDGFNLVLQNKSKDFTEKADKLGLHFSNTISETAQKLKEFGGHVDEASNRILSLDFERNFREMHDELGKLGIGVTSIKQESSKLHLDLKDDFNTRFDTIDTRLTGLSYKIDANKAAIDLLAQENKEIKTLFTSKIEEATKANRNASILNLVILILGCTAVLASLFILK